VPNKPEGAMIESSFSVDQSVLRDLTCPRCKVGRPVLRGGATLVCPKCGAEFPVVEGIPILIDEDHSVFAFEDFVKKKDLFFNYSASGSFARRLLRGRLKAGGSRVSLANYRFLSREIACLSNQSPRVLVLGGSIEGFGLKGLLENNHIEVLETDVSFGPRTRAIVDAHQIPYADGAFDGVVAQAVLEHVIDPGRCVAEIHRVTRPGGLLYVEVPFMQQVHGGPYDFTRWTKTGLRSLVRRFDELRSGAIGGPGTALLWSYEYLLRSLFGYSGSLKIMAKAFAQISGGWLPWLDRLCGLNPASLDAACGLYFLGRRVENPMSDQEVLSYYCLQHPAETSRSELGE
jgi:SAM-dependent methyltransferase/uncharacterized protein YbaR (Trm112 family)